MCLRLLLLLGGVTPPGFLVKTVGAWNPSSVAGARRSSMPHAACPVNMNIAFCDVELRPAIAGVLGQARRQLKTSRQLGRRWAPVLRVGCKIRRRARARPAARGARGPEGANGSCFCSAQLRVASAIDRAALDLFFFFSHH